MNPKLITIKQDNGQTISLNLRDTACACITGDVLTITLFNGDQYKGKLINKE